MNKPFKCPVLTADNRKPVWLTDGQCQKNRENNHHYCLQCDKYETPEKVNVLSREMAVILLWRILDDARDVFTNNWQRIRKDAKKWSGRRLPVRRKERKLFVQEFIDCIELARDVGDVKRWYLSEDTAPGSLNWACEELGNYYENHEKITAEKARERVGLNVIMEKRCGGAHPELQPG